MATATVPTTNVPAAEHAVNRVRMARTAFLAILERDIVVTGREFIPFLLQVLIQPLFLLFIFGKVLPSIGSAGPGFATLLLPGVVAFTAVLTALQGVTLPLVLDLGFAREIDDRLLSPLPIALVAVEKIIFAAMRGILAGAVIFPIAWWILGSGYQVRTDAIPGIIGMLIIAAFAGASLGMTIGTIIKPEQIGLMFSLILTPLLFTGCTYFPWSGLSAIKWFQVVTLFNPLTYASEGMRAVMVPPIHGHVIATIPIGWSLAALFATIILFGILGMRTFRNRVVG